MRVLRAWQSPISSSFCVGDKVMPLDRKGLKHPNKTANYLIDNYLVLRIKYILKNVYYIKQTKICHKCFILY